MAEPDKSSTTNETVSGIIDQLKEGTGQVLSEVDRLRKSGQVALAGLQQRVADSDRKRRVSTLQREIASLQQETDQMAKALGLHLFGLYEQKKLPVSELDKLCEQIVALKQKQKEKEAELTALQPAPPSPPAACSTCGNRLPAEGKFCPFCGTARAEKQPEGPQLQFCAQCGARLRPGMKFCSKCGNPT